LMAEKLSFNVGKIFVIGLMSGATILSFGLWLKKNFSRAHVPIINEIENGDVTLYRKILEKYFSDLTLNDLRQLDPDELISSVEETDRPRMILFVKKYLEHKEKVNGEISNDEITITNGMTITKSGRLNISGILISAKYDSSLFPTYRSTSELNEFFDDYPFVWEYVKYLDLTRATLFPEDLPYITSLVEKMKSCEIVNLSFNRIHITDNMLQLLTNLLQIGHVRYVNIVGNALASMDGKVLFNSLSQDDLKKIIFIPKSWISPGHWKDLIEGSEKQELVEKTHTEFYDYVKNYSYLKSI